MSRRTLSGIAAAVAATAVAAVHLTAQQTPATRPSNQRVWTGTIDDREVMLNATDTTPIRRPVQYYKDVHVSFRFVSETDPNRPGQIRWVSRRLSWTGFGLSSSSIGGRECIGNGSLELGPAAAPDATTPAQDERLKIPCRDWNAPNVWSFIPLPNPKVRLPRIDTTMKPCQTHTWPEGNVRYTLRSDDTLELTSVDNFTIDTTPKMPHIKGAVADPAATWVAEITFSSKRCGGTAPPNLKSPRVTGTGAIFTPSFAAIFGGQVSVTVTTSCGPQTKTQQISGEDPGKPAIQAEIGLVGPPFDPDDLKRIACKESLQRQFYANGKPVHAGGGDIGIMQICYKRNTGDFWDWKFNIQNGRQKLQEMLDFSRQMPRYWRNGRMERIKKPPPGFTVYEANYPRDAIEPSEATNFTEHQLRMEAIKRYNAGTDWDLGYWEWNPAADVWVANPQGGGGGPAYADEVIAKSPTCPTR